MKNPICPKCHCELEKVVPVPGKRDESEKVAPEPGGTTMILYMCPKCKKIEPFLSKEEDKK